MSKCVKAIRRTLKEMCNTPYLDEYFFITTWKARFDFTILGLFTVLLKSLVAQGGQPHHVLQPFFHLWLRSIPQETLNTYRSTPALTLNLLPHPLQTAPLSNSQDQYTHTLGDTLGNETQMRDPCELWKVTPGYLGINFLGAKNSQCDLNRMCIPPTLLMGM